MVTLHSLIACNVMLFLLSSLPVGTTIFTNEEILYPNHGNEFLTPEKVAENTRYHAVQGVVRGNVIEFEVERIPFKTKRGEWLWLRRGKPAEAFRDMVSYAISHGYEIRLNSAYRTYKHQMRLWKRIPHLAGKPGLGGTRTHQTGCSIDIRGTFKEVGGENKKTILYWWLKRFARKFNFVNDVTGEPWHWTYMGPLNEHIKIGGE